MEKKKQLFLIDTQVLEENKYVLSVIQKGYEQILGIYLVFGKEIGVKNYDSL